MAREIFSLPIRVVSSHRVADALSETRSCVGGMITPDHATEPITVIAVEISSVPEKPESVLTIRMGAVPVLNTVHEA